MECARKSERNGHIVVFETDELIRELLTRWLGEAGYVVLAGNHQNRDGEHEPRLIIANISSPRRAEALIRSLQAVYSAPILALSARFRAGLGASTEAACRLGVAQVLPKPFSRKELLGAVRAAIEGRS
jgi:DNA-binding response OmpR family regulator